MSCLCNLVHVRTKVWPTDATEAADRPLYSSLNLRKVDGGNDIFGQVGVVWRLTPVNTGCYEYTFAT
jgi:hypothetical protein